MPVPPYTLYPLAVIAALILLKWLVGVRYIPHNKVGIIEKLWSAKGSLTGRQDHRARRRGRLPGRDPARRPALRSTSPGSTASTRSRSSSIAEGRIGYVYARDGSPLPPTQTLGRVVDVQPLPGRAGVPRQAAASAGASAAILREGVYADQPGAVRGHHRGPRVLRPDPGATDRSMPTWQSAAPRDRRLHAGDHRPRRPGGGGRRGSRGRRRRHPHHRDRHDRHRHRAGRPADRASARSSPPRSSRLEGQTDHNYFQDPEAFLALGGRRGKQLQVLTDGTFFINRWFATVEMQPEDAHPDRLRRRGRVVLRRARRRRHRRRLPLRRAGRVRPARRLEARARRPASTRSTRTRSRSSWCRPSTSSCAGSPARPRSTSTTRTSRASS